MPCLFSHITFLGTSSGAPTKHRNVTSHVVAFNDGSQLMLDCGEGTQHQVIRCDRVKASKLRTILVTHLHGDHCFGLPGFLCSMGMAGSRTDAVKLVGPVGLKDMVETALRYNGGGFVYLPFPVEYQELPPDFRGFVCDHVGVRVSAYPMKHGVPCFGYVLEEEARRGKVDAKLAKSKGVSGRQIGELLQVGKVTTEDGTIVHVDEVVGDTIPGRKLVLLGDTSDSSAIAEAAYGTSLLVHEATLGAGKEEEAVERGHSTSAMAGRFAHSINAKSLILTHFSGRFSATDSSRNGEDVHETSADASVDTLVEEASKMCPNTHVFAAEDLRTFEMSELLRE